MKLDMGLAMEGVAVLVEGLLQRRGVGLEPPREDMVTMYENRARWILKLITLIATCSPKRCESLWKFEHYATFLEEVCVGFVGFGIIPTKAFDRSFCAGGGFPQQVAVTI